MFVPHNTRTTSIDAKKTKKKKTKKKKTKKKKKKTKKKKKKKKTTTKKALFVKTAELMAMLAMTTRTMGFFPDTFCASSLKYSREKRAL